MKMIGFDRRIRLEWLDEVAFYYQKTRDAKACAEYMYEYLAEEMPGHRTRRTLITIMKKIWTDVPSGYESLRDRGLGLLVSSNSKENRLAVHWRMILVMYPFFRDVVGLVGSSFTLQDEISLGNIYRKTVESWGERSTVKHALGKLMGSLWQWGVLDKVKTGTYTPGLLRTVDKTSQTWLIECILRSSNQDESPLIDVLTSPNLFPFKIDVSKEDLAEESGFELSRQGLNREILSISK